MRLYPNFIHEYEIRRMVKDMVNGGVFIDVGAELGVWTIDFASLFDKVYAVEPFFADELEKNLRDYKVDNVVMINKAAWDFNGVVLIGKVENQPGTVGSGVMVGGADRVVESVRLDDVIEESFNLLKIDVEGTGIHVLRGMPNLLKKSSGVAVIEVHNHGESHGTFLMMKEHGWTLKNTLLERRQGDLYHAYKVYVK